MSGSAWHAEPAKEDPPPRGLVGDIDRFATHDGPGIRTAVYLKGCPLSCIWCHSPETQDFEPELLYLEQRCNGCGQCVNACSLGALSLSVTQADGGTGERMSRAVVAWENCTRCGKCAAVCYSGALKMAGNWITVNDLIAQVEKDRPFFDASGGGVTLSGGEATAQAGFALRFLSGCRALGIHTALETNGCAPWQVFAELSRVVDLFLYDVKHMDEASHRRLTGASNQQALSNLRRLAGSGAGVVVRVPCIPGQNDDAANIEATAAFMREAGLHTIHLLPYNTSAGAKYLWLGRDYGLKSLAAQSREEMAGLAAICRSYGLAVQVEG